MPRTVSYNSIELGINIYHRENGGCFRIIGFGPKEITVSDYKDDWHSLSLKDFKNYVHLDSEDEYVSFMRKVKLPEYRDILINKIISDEQV